MAFTEILVEDVDDVSVIRLNQPSSLNAFTPKMLEEVHSAFEVCASRSRAIILTSAGRAFSSGANITTALAPTDRDADFDAGAMLETHINPLMLYLRGLPVPWISAVRGAAAGFGCSIALAADMIVASDTAYFLQAFSRIGLVPDGGAAWLLARSAGRVRAMELMLLGERLPAAKALEWGMINRVVSDDILDTAAIELAAALAAGPTRTFGLIRELAWLAADGELPAVLAAERTSQRKAGATADCAEGFSAFMQKRPPIFSGD
ncbi:enoyl-CoA hydratase/isomerase [soil metagenome]